MVVLAGRGIIRSADTEGLEVTRGHVLFIGQGTALQFEASVGVAGEEELVVYRAFVEVDE
jgi:mannose-6-phosphate isomerase-like protein (cupin superfamily)